VHLQSREFPSIKESKKQHSNSINQAAIKVIIINFCRCVHINLYQSVLIVIPTMRRASHDPIGNKIQRQAENIIKHEKLRNECLKISRGSVLSLSRRRKQIIKIYL
jgi:hypothetical protein